MVTSVDEVEAAPLVGSHRSEGEMGGEGSLVEGPDAFVELGVELFKLGAHAGAELIAGHGGHVALAGTDGFRGRDAAGESSAANDEELQDAMLRTEGLLAGGFSREITVEVLAGVAVGEDEMLDDVLGGPGSCLAATGLSGTKLAGGAIFAAEGFAITGVQFFECGMHGGPESLR